MLYMIVFHLSVLYLLGYVNPKSHLEVQGMFTVLDLDLVVTPGVTCQTSPQEPMGQSPKVTMV